MPEVTVSSKDFPSSDLRRIPRRSPSANTSVGMPAMPPAAAFRVTLCSVTPAAADLLRGHIDVMTSVKGFKCSIVEDDVTYKDTALKRFTAVFSLKGMCILFR